MNIAFFHGLESPAVSDKTEWLDKNYKNVYAPAMDYRDPGLFDQVLKEVKDRKIDVLTGSSMGGWFAYCISTLTGIPTVLFNPAFHSRSFDPNVKTGSRKARHRVVLGKEDDVVNPKETVEWIEKNGIGDFSVNWESNNHRTPLGVYAKHVRGLKESTVFMKRHVKLFEEFLLEEDPLAGLGLEDDAEDKKKKKKEDPLAGLGLEDEKEEKEDEKEKKEDDFFKKEKEAARKQKEREEKKHQEFVEKKKTKIEDLLQDYPEVDQELGDKIIAAVNSQDRVKIRGAFLALMALQIKHQQDGDTATVNHIAQLKDQIEDLDKSYTQDKMI